MALTDCSECGSEISDQAESCPDCGMPEPAETKQEKSNKEVGKDRIPKLVLFSIVVLLGVMVVPKFWSSIKDSKGFIFTKEKRVKKEAWEATKKRILKKLKHPGSSEFCSYSEATVGKNSDAISIGKQDHLKVSGYVDAANSFGAETRYSFKALFDPEMDTVDVVSFEKWN